MLLSVKKISSWFSKQVASLRRKGKPLHVVPLSRGNINVAQKSQMFLELGHDEL